MAKPLTINGVTRTPSEWARSLGISKQAFYLRERGLRDGDNLLRSKNERSKYASDYRLRFGKTLTEMEQEYGFSASTIRYWIGHPDNIHVLIMKSLNRIKILEHILGTVNLKTEKK